jgi:hypothetical protein
MYNCYAATVPAGKLDDREQHTSAVQHYMYCGAVVQDEMVPAAGRRRRKRCSVEALHSEHEQCTCAESHDWQCRDSSTSQQCKTGERTCAQRV